MFRDEAGVFENLEVLRDYRSAHRQHGREFADRLGSFGEAQDDGASGAVSERLPHIPVLVSHHER